MDMPEFGSSFFWLIMFLIMVGSFVSASAGFGFAILLVAALQFFIPTVELVGEIMNNKAQRELMEAFNRGIVQGVYVVTLKAGEKLNGMTAAWVSKVSHLLIRGRSCRTCKTMLIMWEIQAYPCLASTTRDFYPDDT